MEATLINFNNINYYQFVSTKQYLKKTLNLFKMDFLQQLNPPIEISVILL